MAISAETVWKHIKDKDAKKEFNRLEMLDKSMIDILFFDEKKRQLVGMLVEKFHPMKIKKATRTFLYIISAYHNMKDDIGEKLLVLEPQDIEALNEYYNMDVKTATSRQNKKLCANWPPCILKK